MKKSPNSRYCDLCSNGGGKSNQRLEENVVKENLLIWLEDSQISGHPQLQNGTSGRSSISELARNSA